MTKQLTQFSTIPEIKKFLDAHGVAYKPRAKKGELVALLQEVQERIPVDQIEEDHVELITMEDARRYQEIEALVSSNKLFVKKVRNHLFINAPAGAREALRVFGPLPAEDWEPVLPQLGDIPSPALEQVHEPLEDPLVEDGFILYDVEEGVSEPVVLTEAVTEITPTVEVAAPEKVEVSLLDKDETDVTETVEAEKSSWIEDNKRSLIIGGIMIAAFLVTLFVLKYLV